LRTLKGQLNGVLVKEGSCLKRKKNFPSDTILELLRGKLEGEVIKMSSRKKEKCSLRYRTGVLKRLARWRGGKEPLSKKKEKFSLRHCSEVLKRLARWRGCKKPLSKKKEKFSLRHCTGVSGLRTLKG
jgi:hypothetical protein